MSQTLYRNFARVQIGRLGDVRLALAALAVWRERCLQRRELMTLVRDGFDFNDFGVTRALAVQEASKFPWQAFNDRWQDAANAQSKAKASQ
jgi:hypothetical protein